MRSPLETRSKEDHVVALQHVSDQAVRLYKRINGKTVAEDAEFFPFFFLSDASLLSGYEEHYWLKELGGSNHYKFLVAFRRWSDLWDAVNLIVREYNRRYSRTITNFVEIAELHLRPDPLLQFQIHSDITLFGGMNLSELVRMQVVAFWDESARARSRSAAHRRRLASVALASTNGDALVLDVGRLEEAAFLKTLVETIRTIDPDVIEGPGLFTDILPAIEQLAEAQAIDLAIGRSNASLRRIPPRQSSEWSFYEAPGRHLIDSRLLFERNAALLPHATSVLDESMSMMAGASSSQLPPVVAGGRTKSRPSVSQRGIKKYLHTVEEEGATLFKPWFEFAKRYPFNISSLFQSTELSRGESIVLREYVAQKESLPKPGPGTEKRQGAEAEYWQGVFKNILHLCVPNLYAHVMDAENLVPQSDRCEVIRLLSQSLLAESPAAEEATALDILRPSVTQLVLNGRSLFFDGELAAVITLRAETLMRTIRNAVGLHNGKVIQFRGTDLYVELPDNVRGEQNEHSFVDRLSQSIPATLAIRLQRRYLAMLSHRPLNYALSDSTGRVFTEGSAFSHRGHERFIKRFTHRCVECLLAEDVSQLHHTYASFRTLLIRHQVPINDLARTEILKDAADTYRHNVEKLQRPRSAAYEAAIRFGLTWKEGTRIAYYVTGSAADVRILDHARIVDEWDSSLPNENLAYYTARLDDAAARFKDLFSTEDFEKIFSLDSLFAFRPEAIRILQRHVSVEDTPPLLPSAPPSEFGIWLEE